jgi:hypothetical protein
VKPETLVILWALPAGKRDRLHEKPLTSFPITREQADKVQAAATRDGWHGFRRAVETDAPPDFTAGIRGTRKNSPPRSSRRQIVCAWCKRVTRKGRKPATHTICPSCSRKFFGGKPRKNPALGAAPRQIMVRTFRSARGHLVSGDVDAVSYVHIGSRSLKPYRHIFRNTDTELWALADGSLLIRNPSSRLWEDFTVEDAE